MYDIFLLKMGDEFILHDKTQGKSQFFGKHIPGFFLCAPDKNSRRNNSRIQKLITGGY